MADDWAKHLARTQTLNHDDFANRLIAAVGNVTGAENADQGSTTPAECVTAWENSPPHLSNILGDYTHAGAGLAIDANGVFYWVADFARL